MFGPRSYEDPEPPRPQDHYDAVADQALRAFVEAGEPWLARKAGIAGALAAVPLRRRRAAINVVVAVAMLGR